MFVYWAGGFGSFFVAAPGHCNGQIHVTDRCYRTPLLILPAATARSTSQIAVTGPRCCFSPLQQARSTALVAWSTGGRYWPVGHHRPLQVIMILDHVTQLCYVTLFLDSVT